MQTFLIVLGILAVLGVSVVVVGIAFLRKLAAKAAYFVLRTGVDAVNSQAQADYAGPVRERLEAVNKRFKALPAPSIFNAGTIVLAAKELGLELAEISQELDRLKAEDARAKADAITVEATDVTPGAHLALPAPTTEGATPDAAATATDASAPAKSHDAVLAEFRAEFVKPGSGVIDAWLTGAGDDTFIQYQLDAEVATSRVETAGRLSAVPHEYQGLPTIITWFPRQS
jgi:hypothetical protein